MSLTPEEKRASLGEGRVEVGGSASSSLHPPHTSENASDASIQGESESPDAIPVMPANASGRDKVPTADQAAPIDAESMYDQRPERDKDRPPSERED